MHTTRQPTNPCLAPLGSDRAGTANRRRLLGTGLLLGGGGLAALVASPLARALQSEPASDADLLNAALAFEHLEAALYRDGLRAFDEAAFAAAEVDPAVRAALRTIRDHEQAHVEAITLIINDLGGSPVAAETYDFGYDNLPGFLSVATVLENIGVAAYAGLAPAFADKELLAAALAIHSVEARHAAYLSELTADAPFPNAFDEAGSLEEVQTWTAAMTLAAPSAAQSAATPDAESAPATPAAAATPAPAATPRAPGVEEPPIAGAPDPDDRPERQRGDRDRERQGDRFDPVVADAAAQLGLSPSDIAIVETERVEWPDASLGCPVEGEFYAQVITPGFRVIVEGNGTQLEYHTDRQGNFVLC